MTQSQAMHPESVTLTAETSGDHWDDADRSGAGGVSFGNVQFEDITFADEE